jgi:hypothetical protein
VLSPQVGALLFEGVSGLSHNDFRLGSLKANPRYAVFKQDLVRRFHRSGALQLVVLSKPQLAL